MFNKYGFFFLLHRLQFDFIDHFFYKKKTLISFHSVCSQIIYQFLFALNIFLFCVFVFFFHSFCLSSFRSANAYVFDSSLIEKWNEVRNSCADRVRLNNRKIHIFSWFNLQLNWSFNLCQKENEKSESFWMHTNGSFKVYIMRILFIALHFFFQRISFSFLLFFSIYRLCLWASSSTRGCAKMLYWEKSKNFAWISTNSFHHINLSRTTFSSQFFLLVTSTHAAFNFDPIFRHEDYQWKNGKRQPKNDSHVLSCRYNFNSLTFSPLFVSRLSFSLQFCVFCNRVVVVAVERV